jgi:4-hydroxy 2-oxovalerate aldolase
MLTNRYTDCELLELIDAINAIDVYCLAIVDTFGSLHRPSLLHLFRLIDHNLNPDIKIGFHAHNNMQMAFANALDLVQLQTKRDIIIDCSCFGIGRGAGNLPTELIMKYINENIANSYNLTPILDIIETDILPIYHKAPWGYSSHHFISGSMDLHPNYASYLYNQQRLTVVAIQEILEQISESKRQNYDEHYIQELYLRYNEKVVDDDATLKSIATDLSVMANKKVLLIAPGASIGNQRGKITEFIREECPLCVSINFQPQEYAVDFVFFGNQLRFDQYAKTTTAPVIATSNIDTANLKNIGVTNFSLLVDKQAVNEVDNSGMMALRLFKNLGVVEFYMAGFDGFSISQDDYSQSVQVFFSNQAFIISRNLAIIKQLAALQQEVEIAFLTNTIYEATTCD